jgi:hypothetical protein
MALDVYVGSLTRYYAGDWESAAERAARAASRSRQRAPQDPREIPPRALRDTARLRPRVVAWRQALSQSLGANVAVPLDWDESDDAPYFSGQPGWDGLGSLVLWAAYAEHPWLRRPATLPEEWDDDPALVRCNAEGVRSRFSHLVRNVELWLPSPFSFTFEGEDVDGRRIVIGSSATLSRQLAELSAVSWKVDDPDVTSWGHRPPPPDAPLELKARYAFAVLTTLARHAGEHGLPMKLDY